MNILQSKKISPFGTYCVVHYFKLIEFRIRGSLRAHILVRLDNAPKDPLVEDYVVAIDTLLK